MRRTLLFTLALLCGQAHAFDIKPFTASYTADWKQLPVSGSAERRLEQVEGNQWHLVFKASMLVAGLTEESRFNLQENSLTPLTYRYERSGLGNGKKVEQTFDWKTKQLTGDDDGDPVKMALNKGLLDKSSYQLALQRDVADGKQSMSYQVFDGDEVETYDFRVLGSEMVKTKVGQIDAIKVERVRDPTQSSRKTTLWFAKDWDYLLVALNQVEKDGKEYQIMLKDGTVDGRPVQGKN
ncbi:DUF3108 domain-containing protein [Pseudomonas matsuisoli]|uniref:Dehydrogenase n=1 Tax=Pseudomonas matsuisoli TaxID=1515666 RepID=A0A917PJ01_9PSED|nr:DUF3108 domain-containing protein [Pseudomonas matsuisoli]GGJ81148.1 dehydrogenase [Pseudomonas matsuisoli]